MRQPIMNKKSPAAVSSASASAVSQNHHSGRGSLGSSSRPIQRRRLLLSLDAAVGFENSSNSNSNNNNNVKLISNKQDDSSDDDNNNNNSNKNTGDTDENDVDSEATSVDDNYLDNDQQLIVRRSFGSEIYVLTQAALIGIVSGWSVGVFKLSIDALRRFAYGTLVTSPSLVPLIPAMGGVLVGLLSLAGSYPPGLRGTVESIDRQATNASGPENSHRGRRHTALDNLRKTVAAVCTLGTGNSLGPEGPSVELGMSVSRLCINEFPAERTSVEQRKMRYRLLLACGAAAGVAAGFNAPIAGVFFALEIVQGAFRGQSTRSEETIATATSGNISSILIASVLSALTSKTLLGDHLVFDVKEYALRTPLTELPLYVILGALSGLVAFGFSQAASTSKHIFDGEFGPMPLRKLAKKTPTAVKPVIGGLICGLVGLVFPQVLFFGYETLNGLLANGALPGELLFSLLAAKAFTTAVSAGSGLVGGTFAPSLFLGGMTGACFHMFMTVMFQFASASGVDAIQIIAGGPVLELADVPAYAMVGAASVLAALFRAPLTASLLLFELTRDYDVILPLMASAGVGSLVNDLVEQKFERLSRRDEDAVSWGDLSDDQSV